MCVSLIAQVRELLDGGEALVDADSDQRVVSLAPLVLEGAPVAEGDWVLIHTGLAVERLDETDALDMLGEQRAVIDSVRLPPTRRGTSPSSRRSDRDVG